MKMIKTNVLGNRDGLYFDCLNETFLDAELAINYTEVDFVDVNFMIVIRIKDGSYKIIQVSGFSYDEGIFVRMY